MRIAPRHLGLMHDLSAAGRRTIGEILRRAFGRPTRAVSAAHRLIVFSRYPMPGRAKTRLIPVLSPLRAAALQREMTENVVRQSRVFVERDRGCALEVRYAGGGARRMRRWLGGGVGFLPQGDGDIGERMSRAFQQAFEAGCKRVVLIGTDCPQTTSSDVEAAFETLNECDVVLGPSTDGGYWLIGLRRPADLFTGVAWSTAGVLRQTVAKVGHLGLSIALLGEHTDVDEPADLAAQMPDAMHRPPWLSVVIPALNEAGHIATTIESARAEGVEIIVVDGDSTDDTAACARGCRVRVIHSPRGRAVQQNLGAAAATGEVLLFLHADTRLPPRYVDHVFDAMADPRAVGGAFGFRTDYHKWSMRLIEWSVGLRSRHLRMPYGDQAIFVRRAAFEAVGGFPDVSIAEDLEFIRDLARRGSIVMAGADAITSGRRWRTLGILRTTWINQAILLGIALGVPFRKLASLY